MGWRSCPLRSASLWYFAVVVSASSLGEAPRLVSNRVQLRRVAQADKSFGPVSPKVLAGACSCTTGIQGDGCPNAVQACENSFCEPLCLNDVVGCSIEGSAESLQGPAGETLKDELCKLMVGASCVNDFEVCDGGKVFVHYADAANTQGVIKKFIEPVNGVDENSDEKCQVTVKFSLKKANPYSLSGGLKGDPLLDSAPHACGQFVSIGLPCLTQLPQMTSMGSRYEAFKTYFNGKKSSAESAATKRAMSCLGCAGDNGNECDFKQLFGVDY
jgi:hypothetical protein